MIDAFLQLLDDKGKAVLGESKDQAFPKWIELRGVDLGGGGIRGTAAEKTGAAVDDLDDRMNKLTAVLQKLREARAEDVKTVTATAADALTNAGEIRTRIAALRKALDEGKADDKSKTEAQNLQHAANQSAEGGTPNRLKFSCDKLIDAASADLFQMYARQCAAAKVGAAYYNLGEFKQATVVVRKLFDGTPQPYLKAVFERVLLEDYKVSYGSGEGTMKEDLTFVFTDFSLEYYPQKKDGTRDVAVVVSDTVGGAVTGGGA